MATVTKEFYPEQAQLPSSGSAQLSYNDGTNFPVYGLAFDAATQEECFFKFIANDYGSGNVTVTLWWHADTATTNAVRWGAAIGAVSPADTVSRRTDAIGGTAVESNTTTSGTANDAVTTALTLTSLDSLAADDLVVLWVYREAADAGDTMAGDAILEMVVVSYSDT